MIIRDLEDLEVVSEKDTVKGGFRLEQPTLLDSEQGGQVLKSRIAVW